MTHIKIEIKSTKVTTVTKPWGDLLVQQGWAYIPDQDGEFPPYPKEIEVQVNSAGDAYAPGYYGLSGSTFYTKYNRLTAGNPVLFRMEAKAKAAA